MYSELATIMPLEGTSGLDQYLALQLARRHKLENQYDEQGLIADYYWNPAQGIIVVTDIPDAASTDSSLIQKRLRGFRKIW